MIRRISQEEIDLTAKYQQQILRRMKYQLKTKDGRFAWVFEDGSLLCVFASEKEAQDWHYKTYGEPSRSRVWPVS